MTPNALGVFFRWILPWDIGFLPRPFFGRQMYKDPWNTKNALGFASGMNHMTWSIYVWPEFPKKTWFGRKYEWNSQFLALSMCFRWRFQSPNLGEPNVCFFHGNLKQLQEAAFVQIKCCSFLFETKESRWHVVQCVLVAFFLRIFLTKWWHNVATFPSNVHLVHPKIHRIYWRYFYECKVCLQI